MMTYLFRPSRLATRLLAFTLQKSAATNGNRSPAASWSIYSPWHDGTVSDAPELLVETTASCYLQLRRRLLR